MVRSPAGARDLSRVQSFQTGSEVHVPYSLATKDSFRPNIERLWPAADHSHRCTEQIKAEMRLHFNLLKPTGHVMHQQFNIQQLYVLPTLFLFVLYLSENKQRPVPLTA